jgi:aldehyde dehydrogenase (NAD+)
MKLMPPTQVDHSLMSFEPANPSRVVAELPAISSADADSLVGRCGSAAPAWAANGFARSAALGSFADALEKRTDDLGDLIAREVGKPIGEARAEVGRAAAILRFYAQQALAPDAVAFPSPDGSSRVSARRVPLGTVLLVCPWNFPLAIPIWKAAPALAYGNTVLLKPAGAAIGVGAAIAEAASEALPDGVLEVLNVRGRDLGSLLDDARIAGVSFTGSTQVGMSLIERVAARSGHVQAEMGGHNAAIVLDDADVDRAADAIVAGATGYAGQKCTATRRVVTLPVIHDALVEALKVRWEALRVGDPLEPGVTVGPLIDEDAVDEYETALAGALDDGGELLEKTAPSRFFQGHFVSPALMALDDPDATANQEETFGPLLTVIRARDIDHAVEIANGTRYGLTGAVHGRDLDRATAVAQRLDTGMQRVNATTTGVDFYAPFGGTGASSYGPREQGEAAREFYTEWRTLMVTPYPAEATR